MAAYAALVSLMTTLNNIQTHPRVSTFFHHKHIQSLHQIINVLLDFMDSNNSYGSNREEEALERRIACVAHEVEDVIESHIADQILGGSTHLIELETQIEAMNSVMEFQEKLVSFKHEQSSPSISLVDQILAGYTATNTYFVVGFDEKLIQIIDRLTGYQPDLQIVPIVGMGGIGKTTLAKSVYDNLLIVESFDIRAWVTISQEYRVKNVLSELLSCIGDRKMNKRIGAVDFEMGFETEGHQLGLKLYKALFCRRYLIVLDDIWSLEAWDKIKCFFPNNDDRSRVVITTRILSVATQLSSSSIEMNFLDEGQSWRLFCGNVFPEKDCPPELEEIGKQIVRKCKGLPLSIVVIGGLLRNSISTREYWEKFARDLNSILTSGNDAYCSSILSLSYNHLPAHLKPCFLYMGVFKEDVKLHVSRLTTIFVAEGFLKPKEGQTLEEVAEDYLNDLVDRNLILVDSWKLNGRIKYYKIHDLVRKICLEIGAREKFFYGMRKLHIPTCINGERRMVFDDTIPDEKNWPKVFDALPSASLVRTFLSDGGPLPFKFRLLRVLAHIEFGSGEDISQHVNLRYLKWSLKHESNHYKLPTSISLLWNVHTLIFRNNFIQIDAPSEIWHMRQLRHVLFYRVFLPDPPSSDKVEQQDDVLLPNLQTLSTLVNFNFTEEVCKRIPNIKKLRIKNTDIFGEECQRKCHLEHLNKLQSLYCSLGVSKRGDFRQSLVLPSSLRKLSLKNCHLHWEELNTFGLSLPHLELLKLHQNAVVGPVWDCVEGAFTRLKFLQIMCRDLIKWTSENSDFFPVLEKLHLGHLSKLERIPSGIGEIQTLESLCLHCCNLTAAISSVEILEEQMSFGNEDLQLILSLKNEEVKSFRKKVDIESFTSKNFQLFRISNFS